MSVATPPVPDMAERARWSDEISFDEAEFRFPGATAHCDYAIAHILCAPDARLRVLERHRMSGLPGRAYLLAQTVALEPWLSLARRGSLACYLRRYRKSNRGQSPSPENISRERARIDTLPYTTCARWIPEVGVWSRCTAAWWTDPRWTDPRPVRCA